MRSLFTLLFFHFAFGVSAQTDTAFTVSSHVFPWFDPTALQLSDSGKVSVHIGSGFLLGSSAQPVSFTDKLLFGGFITDAEKAKVGQRLNDLNYGGIDFESDVYFSFKTDSLSKNSALFIGGGYTYLQGLAYTTDFFNLMFYGNAPYAGDTATFSNSAFNGFTLAEYKAGFVSQWQGKQGQWTAGFAAGVYQGLSAHRAMVHTGILATAAGGTQLDIAMDFEYNNTGAEPVRFNKPKGWGYGMDAFVKFQNIEKQFEVNAAIQDIGMIFWNNTPHNYFADTGYIYDGIDITYVFNSGSSPNADVNDSIFEILGIDTSALPFQTPAPSKLNVSFTKYFGYSGVFLNAGVQYFVFMPYQLFVYGRCGKNFPKAEMQISGIAHIGGFGSYGIGVDMEKKLFNDIYLRVGSNSILGFIAPHTFNTASVFGSIRKTF